MIGYRWKVLAIMVLGSFINYIDRTALPIAAPYVMNEFNFTPAEMGMIFSSFFLTYPLFCFIGGYLSDIYGPKKTLAFAMAVWSLFAGAPAIAWGFTSMIVFRALFGAGEGPGGSGRNKMVSNGFPVAERAKAKGISDSGMSLGAAVSGPIVGLIALQYGWRISFILLTLLGLVWTVAWVRMVSDSPRQHPKVTPEELTIIESGQSIVSADSPKRPLRDYLRQPLILAVAVAYFATNYVTYFFLTWFPSYLVMAHNLSIKNMSIVSVIPWLLGALGYITGGTLSDYLVKRGSNPIFARKIVISVFLSVVALSIGLCGIVSSTTMAITLMSIGTFCTNLITPCYWAIIQDSVQSKNVGGVGGFVHFLSNISGIFAPAITGFIIQGTGHFNSAFFVTGFLAIVGSFAIALFAKPIKDNMKEKTLAV